MRAETRDTLLLIGKSVVFVFGFILLSAATVDLVVDGWDPATALTFVVGLLLAGTPLALAFRDALRAGRPPA